MVSGSAALPVQMLERWREISGHTLLERYGMTEIGMALSNPLHGERRPGSSARRCPASRSAWSTSRRRRSRGAPGEIEVRGPGVFREYWRRPDATRDGVPDGWFRTGDVAVPTRRATASSGAQRRHHQDRRLQGSALEIEEVLREHPAIAECAVVGIPTRSGASGLPPWCRETGNAHIEEMQGVRERAARTVQGAGPVLLARSASQRDGQGREAAHQAALHHPAMTFRGSISVHGTIVSVRGRNGELRPVPLPLSSLAPAPGGCSRTPAPSAGRRTCPG